MMPGVPLSLSRAWLEGGKHPITCGEEAGRYG
jgi:hypothetical protein